MRVLSKFTAIALAMAIILSASGTNASAKELSQNTDTANITTADGARTVYKNENYFIYTDKWTKVYTGSGAERWIHITPKIQGLPIQIRMIDYSGEVVWPDTVPSSGTSHWYVGANVQYVKLCGGPSQVNVTVTDH